MPKFEVEYSDAESKTQQLTSKVEDSTSSVIQPTDQNIQDIKSSKHFHASLLEKAFHPLTERSQRLQFDKLFSKGFTFPIDKELISPATRVMLNNTNPLMQHICLKMWLECENGVYNTGDLVRRTKYLLEGLQFNRRFASDIYLGIVPIVIDKEAKRNVIECGPLIREPGNVTLDYDA